MTGIVVRPAAAGDAEGLAEVHAAAWERAYGEILTTGALAGAGYEPRLEMWRNLLADAGRAPWVDVALLPAGGGEQVVGFAWSRLTGQPEAAFEAEIVALNVHPDHWRRGAGRRLMAAAAGRLDAAGARSVYLWVFEANERARAFYRSLGGRIVDRGRDSLGDVTVPTLAFAWKPLSTLVTAAAAS